MGRFMRTFKAVKPTARTLCGHFSDKSAQKIREMRVDTLSQMMTAGNVRAGANYLLVDDLGGLLTAAVLERTRGTTSHLYAIVWQHHS
jgi:tRNA (adenine-N(1)-)-methyltransferase non-catalytic subunit